MKPRDVLISLTIVVICSIGISYVLTTFANRAKGAGTQAKNAAARAAELEGNLDARNEEFQTRNEQLQAARERVAEQSRDLEQALARISGLTRTLERERAAHANTSVALDASNRERWEITRQLSGERRDHENTKLAHNALEDWKAEHEAEDGDCVQKLERKVTSQRDLIETLYTEIERLKGD